MGSKILDLLEEEAEAIKHMGQWNPSMFDNSYSSKFLMGPMTKLAGYTCSYQIFFNRVKVGGGVLRRWHSGKKKKY